MTKVRKQKKAKSFNYGANRRKMNNKRKVPLVKDKMLRESWEEKKTTVQNLAEMGLAYDPNETIPLPGKKMKKGNASFPALIEKDKKFVSEIIEEEATGPMKKIFRLPKAQVETLTKLLDKYGGNFNEMAKDKLNIFQYTPKQLKQRVKQFKSIPEQWQPYIESRMETEGTKIDEKSAIEAEASTLSEKRMKKRLAKRGGKLVLKGNETKPTVPEEAEESMEEDESDDSAPEQASDVDNIPMGDTAESSKIEVNEIINSSKTAEESNSEGKKKKRRRRKKKASAKDSDGAKEVGSPVVSAENETKKKKRKRNKKKKQQNTDLGMSTHENGVTSAKTSIVETSPAGDTSQSQKKKRKKKSKSPLSGSPASPSVDKGSLLASKLQKKREKRIAKRKALKANKSSP